jgi:hypothetical protein
MTIHAEPLDETFLCRPGGLPAEVARELRDAAS